MKVSTALACLSWVPIAAACGGSGATTPPPSPAVHELATLQARGQLDLARLECGIDAVALMFEDIEARLPTIRASERTARRWAGTDHARSVQDGMAAGDARMAAARLSQAMARGAQSAEADGDIDRAALYSSWAMDLLHAEATEGGAVAGTAAPTIPWSDDEVAWLADYARLRADVSDAPDSSEARVRVQALEAQDPVLVEDYAVMLLNAYRDPGLPCAG